KVVQRPRRATDGVINGTGGIEHDHAGAETARGALPGAIAATQAPQEKGGINRPDTGRAMGGRANRLAHSPERPDLVRHPLPTLPSRQLETVRKGDRTPKLCGRALVFKGDRRALCPFRSAARWSLPAASLISNRRYV